MKVRAVLARLRADGWDVVRVTGSHRQLRHASKPGTVTLSGHLNDDMQAGTLRSIWRQAGLEPEQ
ncbi:MAG: type II toxin-antitoxin system HicA family toxin [Armatimonadetes bacterium]|nr:type II toxin-antitoxin system HicA family toxin [Armatimonadota bacterium]